MISKNLDKSTDDCGKDLRRFLVVGPPHGDFTLLLSILNILYRDKCIEKNQTQTLVNGFMPLCADFVDAAMLNYLEPKIDPADLFYSKEFKLLVGGPKWMDDEDEETVCVRKYLGVRDMGDFTFIQYVPRFAMDFDDVVHSHSHPRRWTEEPYYRNYLKFTSIRNPIDIIHSSVYSINALTSDYIQRCVSGNDDNIRLELALNKLTNLEFIEGLVQFLKTYLDEFMPVKDRFRYMMRWEDLIQKPIKTIKEIGRCAEIDVDTSYAERIWKEIDHRNLTTHHKHSFIKGVLHDWKNSITNSHLELFKQHGFNDYLKKFGYPEIEFFDESDYTPVQKTIEEHIKKGKVYSYSGDENLYTFAFNKTNFVPTGRYKFKTYPKNGGIKIEKSMFRNEELLLGFIEKMGPALSTVSEFLVDLRRASENSAEEGDRPFKSVEEKYRKVFTSELGKKGSNAYFDAFSSIQKTMEVESVPILVDSYKEHNIVKIRRKFFGVPQSMGPMDFTTDDPAEYPEIISDSTVIKVKATIDGAV